MRDILCTPKWRKITIWMGHNGTKLPEIH
jgi:hypothetical protein